MIKGMTGFGTAEITKKDFQAVMEIKSVNHRYIDYGFYLPPGFDAMEGDLRDIIGRKIKRGRVNVVLKVLKRPSREVFLNKEAIRRYIRLTKTLKKEFGIKGDLGLQELIQLPGVVETKDQIVQVKELTRIVAKVAQKAVNSVVAMRVREGRALDKDIREQLRLMNTQVRTIRARSKKAAQEKKKELSDEEYRSYQKGSDVNEEITRLEHHICESRLLLKSPAPVGKKIDFIAQEMQRETNTIGSKLQDRLVANAVILLKSKIEKIREQAQNAE